MATKKTSKIAPEDLNLALPPESIFHALTAPDMQYIPLLLFDNTGKPFAQLYNKTSLPYQKSNRVPRGIIPKLHHLLERLKYAEIALYTQQQLLSAMLPEGFLCIVAERECALEFPNLPVGEDFRAWKKKHPSRAMLFAGFGIVDDKGRTCRLNLDFSLHPRSSFDYSKTFPHSLFEYLVPSIQSYNACIKDMFKEGLTVVPANYYDEFASMPHELREALGIPILEIPTWPI